MPVSRLITLTRGAFQSHMADPKTACSLLILCHTIGVPEQEEISSGLSSGTAVYQLKEPVLPAVFLKQVGDLISTL